LVKDQYADTKVILSQTAVYTLASIIIVIGDYFYTTTSMGNPYKYTYENTNQNEIADMSMLIVGQLLAQGFYQLLIFIFHKVFNKRRHDPHVSVFEVVTELFRGGPGNETFVMARMHRVMVVREYGDQIESENEESLPLLSSSDVSANFGSIQSLPTTRRSLPSTTTSWMADEHSTINPALESIDDTLSHSSSNLLL